MEYLRWILLAAGIFFILFVYLLGRNRRCNNSAEIIESEDELPEFSAQDWDDLDEGVGEVRIIARDASEDYLEDAALDSQPFAKNEDSIEAAADQAPAVEDDDDVPQIDSTAEHEPAEEPRQQQQATNSDIIVLHILARPEQQFSGEKINSAAISSGLKFGEMNIYHRLNDYGQSVYSLANMVEPGSFDPASLLELQTPGLTMFMQVSEVVEAEDAFNDMLQCAYRMSELLDGQLCNRRRQTLTQSDAEQYRELVSGVDA